MTASDILLKGNYVPFLVFAGRTDEDDTGLLSSGFACPSRSHTRSKSTSGTYGNLSERSPSHENIHTSRYRQSQLYGLCNDLMVFNKDDRKRTTSDCSDNVIHVPGIRPLFHPFWLCSRRSISTFGNAVQPSSFPRRTGQYVFVIPIFSPCLCRRATCELVIEGGRSGHAYRRSCKGCCDSSLVLVRTIRLPIFLRNGMLGLISLLEGCRMPFGWGT